MVWTVKAKQANANLEVAILQDGECIGDVARALSSVISERSSTGFYTRTTGEYVGSVVVNGIISTDRFEAEDLSATAGADVSRGGQRTINRKENYHSVDGKPRTDTHGHERLLQDGNLFLNITLKGRRILNVDLGSMLGISVKVKLVNENCVDTLSCIVNGAFPDDLPVKNASVIEVSVLYPGSMNLLSGTYCSKRDLTTSMLNNRFLLSG